MQTIKVKAAGGARVRRAEKPEEIISDKAVEVPANQYYLRRIREGSLIKVEAGGKKKEATK